MWSWYYLEVREEEMSGCDGFDWHDHIGGQWCHWKSRQQILMNAGL